MLFLKNKFFFPAVVAGLIVLLAVILILNPFSPPVAKSENNENTASEITAENDEPVNENNEPAFVIIKTEAVEVKVSVEVADNFEEHSKGLMFRESLPEDSGMLFVFQDNQPRTFWMKNTLIPLDIIFIDSDFLITNITQAVPCKEDPCSYYKSEGGAKYVLEVNQGFSENHGLKSSSKISLS